jgi:hypothetical protein
MGDTHTRTVASVMAECQRCKRWAPHPPVGLRTLEACCCCCCCCCWAHLHRLLLLLLLLVLPRAVVRTGVSQYGSQDIQLAAAEQLVERSQTRAIADALKWLQARLSAQQQQQQQQQQAQPLALRGWVDQLEAAFDAQVRARARVKVGGGMCGLCGCVSAWCVCVCVCARARVCVYVRQCAAAPTTSPPPPPPPPPPHTHTTPGPGRVGAPHAAWKLCAPAAV